MNDDENEPENPVTKLAEQTSEAIKQATQSMNETAQRSAQTMQENAKRGMQTMHDAGKAAQDATRRTAEASIAGMAEFSKMFSEMKWPVLPDMDGLIAAHRRNLETLSAANRVALEGAQTVAKRHMEIVQQTMQEMTETIRDLAMPGSAQDRAAKQATLIKQAYERAVAHMKELAELIQRSNGEALAMLNQRFAEAMDEVKALAEKAGPHSGA
jgi:phasin family protein